MRVVDALVGVALLFVVLMGCVTIRRHLLQRRGGAIDLSLRLRPGRRGRGWAFGVGRFQGDELLWYRVFSFAARPRCALPRSGMQITSSRRPSGAEALSLMGDSVVVDCVGSDGRTVELAMSEGALRGFRAWLEATPERGPEIT